MLNLFVIKTVKAVRGTNKNKILRGAKWQEDFQLTVLI